MYGWLKSSLTSLGKNMAFSRLLLSLFDSAAWHEAGPVPSHLDLRVGILVLPLSMGSPDAYLCAIQTDFLLTVARKQP